MRILFLNQFFWPDLAATGLLLTDLVRHLSDQGHEISVICGSASYSVAEHTAPPGANIIRVPSLKFGHSKLTRVLSYASFYVGCAWQAMRGPKPDVVISMTTPPLVSLIGEGLRRFKGSRHFIWEMDMYPDVAVDLNVLTPDSILTRCVGAAADYPRTNAEGVIALGECMKRRLVQRGIEPSRIHIAHNWADGSLIRPPEKRRTTEMLTLVYAGHLGLAHDIETIAGAMEQLHGGGRHRAIFVGGGARAEELQKLCAQKQIQNVEFISFCTRDKLNDILAQADIGLVTQKDDCNGSLVPSKVYSLLAGGLPLIYIGPASATPAMILTEHCCGWHVRCGDVPRLTALVDDLASDRAEVIRRGELARSVFLDHFDRPHAVRRIEAILGVAPVSKVTNAA